MTSFLAVGAMSAARGPSVYREHNEIVRREGDLRELTDRRLVFKPGTAETAQGMHDCGQGNLER